MGQPHILIFPFPAQGHIKPMLCLAELLCQAGLQVTFLNTRHNHRRLNKLQDFSTHFPTLHFESISDGLPEDHPRNLLHFMDLSPTCIIADGLIISSAIDAAEEFGIPVFAFRTYSACSVWVYFHLSNLVEVGEVPFQDKDLDKAITQIPDLGNVIRFRDLPSCCRIAKIDKRAIEFSIDEFNAAAVTKPEFHKLLVSLSRETEGMRRQPPTCIIADGFMSCSAIEVAEEFGIPVFTFRTCSACCTWTCFNLLNLVEEGEVPFQVRAVTKPELCQLLVSLRREGRMQPPTCIIADGIMSCAAVEVAEEFGIPVFTFRTFSASSTWTYFHLLDLIEAGEVPFQEEKVLAEGPGGQLENYFVC
ncbi:UDP-glucuronosyl/UDP-glucosyltransferase [Corchorus capsularis]|uniref:UDP-glucuronosyl/UDP-glucosyltransferase n=1 Tax=Corchorus capsularis TaxID=210143 RepID=A0A1R3H811_COCAP|nr:UDP-glucuronosyl/UDP-glucosyltransferase [Corchorus capsularis]